MAPSCFALQVPDVRGLQVQRPSCASFLLEATKSRAGPGNEARYDGTNRRSLQLASFPGAWERGYDPRVSID